MSARRPPHEEPNGSAPSGAASAHEAGPGGLSLEAAARHGRLQVPDDLASLDDSAYAPVRLGGPDPDEPVAGAPKPGSDADADGALGVEPDVKKPTAPAQPPVRSRSAASVRASMRPRKPAPRPTTTPTTRPARQARSAERAARLPPTPRRPSRLARLLTVTAVLGAVVAVVLVVRPLDRGDAPTPDPATQLAAEQERSARLETALRRESEQRHAWEMWAREFDPRRYRQLKRRAAARARNDDSGG